MSVVTIARMIKLEKNKDLSLPMDFIENLKFRDMEKRWAVMIFELKMGLVRIIPTKSPSVIKVLVEYNQSELNATQELGEVFMRNKIKTIYSGGPCRCGVIPPHRGYEGYIESYKLSVSQDQLRSELLAMTNVTKVEITKYSL
jgi:hypothetical protein